MTRGQPVEVYFASQDHALDNGTLVQKGQWVVNRASVLPDYEFRLRFMEIPATSSETEYVDPLEEIEIRTTKEGVIPVVKVIDHRSNLTASCGEFPIRKENLKKALEQLRDKQEWKAWIGDSAYLVSRGARPRAFETVQGLTKKELIELLEGPAYPGAIPYLIETVHKDGETFYEFGFVAEPFIVDLLLYINKAPDNIQKAINGLLLGYSPSAIQSLIDRKTGTRNMRQTKTVFRKIS